MLPDTSSDKNRDIDAPGPRIVELVGATPRAPIEPPYHRHLRESYNCCCLVGFGQQEQPVASSRHFSADDRIAFQTLTDFVAGDIAAAVSSHGRSAERPGMVPRFLHPLVVHDSASDEHYLIVELHDRNRRPVGTSRRWLQIGSAGPRHDCEKRRSKNDSFW